LLKIGSGHRYPVLIGATKRRPYEPKFGTGDANVGTGDRKVGVGDLKAGMGERNTGVGDRKLGVGERKLGVGDRNAGSGEVNVGTDEAKFGTGTPNDRRVAADVRRVVDVVRARPVADCVANAADSARDAMVWLSSTLSGTGVAFVPEVLTAANGTTLAVRQRASRPSTKSRIVRAWRYSIRDRMVILLRAFARASGESADGSFRVSSACLPSGLQPGPHAAAAE
jgi:hypothetical protein